MRVETDLNNVNPQKILAYVVTGDGRAEYEVLCGLAKKYNGKYKILLFQKSPEHKITGLHVLKSLKTIYKINSYTTFLVLLDREHFDTHLLRKILSQEFTEFEIEGNNPYVIIAKPFRIFLVILGIHKCIEEDIATLISLEFGMDIKPDKTVIRRFLREKKIKSRVKLIESSKKGNLERAFRPLTQALHMLEFGK